MCGGEARKPSRQTVKESEREGRENILDGEMENERQVCAMK